MTGAQGRRRTRRDGPPDAAEIRVALTALLVDSGAGPGIVVHELGLRKGRCRADVAVIAARLHGYEIKSDRDGWAHLDNQVRTYGEMFDRATLVAGERTAQRAAERIPAWWGLSTARGRPVEFEVVREPQDNPKAGARTIAEHLWRAEALELAEAHGIGRGVRSKPRDAIWDRLAEMLPFETIHDAVRMALQKRRYIQQNGGSLSWNIRGPATPGGGK